MSTEALRDAIAEVLVSRDIMRLTEPADWRNEVDAIMALPEIVAALEAQADLAARR